MLQFRNETPFTGKIGLMPDATGLDTMVAVVKGTFSLTSRPKVAAEQVPVAMEPEYYGDPVETSMRVAPDISLPKPGTDILVIGCASAPLGRPVSEMLVEVHVGSVSRYARVYGDRWWRNTVHGYAMTRPEPFDLMPLTWERAFGGREQTAEGWHEFSRNPVGTGFRASDGLYLFDGLALPNIEHPAQTVTSWRDRPDPVGFGPVSPHWEPRRSWAGTYDEAWQESRAPYLPEDFDARFLQAAPPDAIANTPLAGGEGLTLRGLLPEGDLSGFLPRADLRVAFVLDGTPHDQPVMLDTVVLQTDLRQLIMTWRAAFPCDKRALRVSEVRATLQSIE